MFGVCVSAGGDCGLTFVALSTATTYHRKVDVLGAMRVEYDATMESSSDKFHVGIPNVA
jgi:hypothetical protein